jgi:hypothetical protein
MNWREQSDNHYGKSLKTMVQVDENTIVTAELYYREHLPAGRKYYELSFAERKTLGYEMVLHVSKMTKGTYAYSGGLGRFVRLELQPVSRRVVKLLQQEADKLSEWDIIQYGIHDDTAGKAVA